MSILVTCALVDAAACRIQSRPLDDEWAEEAERAMHHWLGSDPQSNFGCHKYKLELLAVSEAEPKPKIECYLSQRDAAREG